MEELQYFEPIRTGRAADLERFVDLLDVAVVNLHDAGRTAGGIFYNTLQKKLPEIC